MGFGEYYTCYGIIKMIGKRLFDYEKNVLHLSCRIISLFIAVFMMAMVILSSILSANALMNDSYYKKT